MPVAALALTCALACSDPADVVADAPPAGDVAAPDGMHVDDGPPVRRACTENLGSMLSMSFGRLDGILVAIVPPGGSACNADADHIHLQIESLGSVYDVAINVGTNVAGDVLTGTRDLALPGPAWAQKWHTGVAINYVSMNVHSTDLTPKSRAAMIAELMAELDTVNHVSVFATGYAPSGAHLVHRNSNGRDGLLITQPLSNPAHLRMFAFSDQTF